MPDWQAIADHIQNATGDHLDNPEIHAIVGGCINDGYLLQQDEQRYFVKTNRASLREMFEAEMEGLLEMASADAISVPQPICCGTAGRHAFLAMEYLPFASGSGNSTQAGLQLAKMHQKTSDHFGWHRNNTIGSTPQQNDWQDNWIDFWKEQRLGFQLQLAASNGHVGKLQKSGRHLMDNLPRFFNHYQPLPSLLHGDLWGGNIGYLATGHAVIFDPACYYGDRETDIAMTRLFGGFDKNFYIGYQSQWPLDAGYDQRKDLYKLYHILNHLNLFGEAYLRQSLNLLDNLLESIDY